MGSMATNGSVHMDTYVSDFCCDIDLNGEVIFYAVTNAMKCLKEPLQDCFLKVDLH